MDDKTMTRLITRAFLRITIISFGALLAIWALVLIIFVAYTLVAGRTLW